MAQVNFRQGTPVKTLDLVYCTIEYYKPEQGGPYYLLTNGAQPDHPLRLFQTSMDNLVKALPKAITQAQTMDKTELANDVRHEIAQIVQHGMTKVRLYVNMYETRAIIWLRLFSGKPQGPVLPTKCGVRFHLEDDIQAIVNFANVD